MNAFPQLPPRLLEYARRYRMHPCELAQAALEEMAGHVGERMARGPGLDEPEPGDPLPERGGW